MKYRPEIDGLRALAVVPVILCHAGIEAFSGGFVGVDVFFVISGYLITLIIYGELQNEQFSIVQFYERRVRRILPALFFVTLVCIPFAWMWMMPDELKDFSKSVVKVNLFISNFYFWKESNYFAPDAQLAPMLHTWSLAVEEQFYVLFPLILILLKKCTPKILLVFLSILVLVSLGLSEWGSTAFPVANYYLLPTRAWELGIGSIVAISMNYWQKTDGWVAQFASVLGLLLVLFAIFTFDDTTLFPGLWALSPVLGTALIIAYAKPDTFVGGVLSWKPMVGIGLISYSAYLWHHPLFAFARIRFQGDVLTEIYLGLSITALGLAYLTWRFVERPFRNKLKFSRKQIFIGATVVSISFIVAGKVGRLQEGIPDRLPLEVRDMVAWAHDKNPRRDECHAKKGRFIEPEKSCVYGGVVSPKFAVLGDSHAMGLAYQLSLKLIQQGRGLRELSYSACAPVVGYRRTDKVDECPKYNQHVQQFLFSHKEIETVILFARWPLYLEGKRFDNQQGGVEFGKSIYAIPVEEDLDFIKSPERISTIGRLYRATVQNYLEHGKHVVLVYPVPEVGWHVPYYLAKEILFDTERLELLSTSFEVFKQRTKNANEQLDKISDHPNLARVKVEEIFCNTFMVDRCVAQMDRKPLYIDTNHLNSIGTSMLSTKVMKTLQENQWL